MPHVIIYTEEIEEHGFCQQRPALSIVTIGFYDCLRLKTVIIDSPVAIAYEYAFAKSGVTDMKFNEEVAVMLHITALDDCEDLPKFDKLFDKPFKGKYLMCGGEAFHEWEDELRRQNYIFNKLIEVAPDTKKGCLYVNE